MGLQRTVVMNLIVGTDCGFAAHGRDEFNAIPENKFGMKIVSRIYV